MTVNVKSGVAQSLTQKRCLAPVLIRRLLSTMERAEVSDTDRKKIPLEVWQLCSFLGKRFLALFLRVMGRYTFKIKRAFWIYL